MTRVEQDTLARDVGHGFRWSLAGQIVNRVGILGAGIVLARVLTKHDFGVYAVALVALNLLITVNELGITAALIRWQGDFRHAARTGATIAFGATVVMFGVVFVCAPLFAELLGAASAAGVVRLLAVSLLFDGAVVVPIAALSRTFRQDRIAIAEFGGLIVYVVVSVSMALLGSGPWSIAGGRVLGSMLTAVLLLTFSPIRPRPGFDRAIARQQLRFGLPLVASGCVAEAVLSVDYLVVGHTLGPVALGVYLLAFNLSTWPISAVLVAVGRVALAGFARLLDDRERMAAACVRAIGVITSATLPLALLLALLAPQVLTFLYGARWIDAATPLRFLLVLAVARVLVQVAFEYLVADGRPRTPLFILCLWLAVLIPALFAGAELDGIRGVGTAHMIVVVLVTVPVTLRALQVAGVSVGALARVVVRPLLAASVMALVVLAVEPVLSGAFTTLVVAGGLGLAMYLLVLAPRNETVQWTRQHLLPMRTTP